MKHRRIRLAGQDRQAGLASQIRKCMGPLQPDRTSKIREMYGETSPNPARESGSASWTRKSDSPVYGALTARQDEQDT